MRTRWSSSVVWGFERLFGLYLRWGLADVLFAGLPLRVPPGHAVILTANHVSWWDGFLLREIHRRTTTAPLFTLMLEEQLQTFPPFRWMGVYGLERGKPAALRDYFRWLEAQKATYPTCWVSIFPQGRIGPSWQRPLQFEGGVLQVAQRLAPAVVVPVGLHLEVLTKPKPYAFVSVGEAMLVEKGRMTTATLAEAVTEQVDAILTVLGQHGEKAPQHWPPNRGA